ncbi:hypothetical protein HUJ04_011342 [Dendroctonus ponderosae]|nr:hypothetical protein HUJ04_011342 [Dendroctonus ponderosae]
MVVLPYQTIPEKVAMSIPEGWGIGRSENGGDENPRGVILRIVTKAPYFVRHTTLRRDLDAEDLLDHIRNLTSGFLDRIRHSKNPTSKKKTWTTCDDQFLHHNDDRGLDLS